MTATPLKDLFAKVPALNNPTEPITYEVDGDKLVAKWDIVRAKSLYPKEFKTIDKKFSVTVDFDEKKGTWKPKEKSSESGASIGSGGISFGSSSSTFSGKSANKGFSFEAGGISKKKGEDASPVLSYSWDIAKIKEPLYAFLESEGWTRKKGLFG
jgi:hypothetical protein